MWEYNILSNPYARHGPHMLHRERESRPRNETPAAAPPRHPLRAKILSRDARHPACATHLAATRRSTRRSRSRSRYSPASALAHPSVENDISSVRSKNWPSHHAPVISSRESYVHERLEERPAARAERCVFASRDSFLSITCAHGAHQNLARRCHKGGAREKWRT